jgi:hypothetical protein
LSRSARPRAMAASSSTIRILTEQALAFAPPVRGRRHREARRTVSKDQIGASSRILGPGADRNHSRAACIALDQRCRRSLGSKPKQIERKFRHAPFREPFARFRSRSLKWRLRTFQDFPSARIVHTSLSNQLENLNSRSNPCWSLQQPRPTQIQSETVSPTKDSNCI